MFILIYVLFWLTLFGAVIGSFLNVVIYRYPLGKSLSHPPSHCPKCQHLIRWYDNVPVFGWLFLKGRCRDCQAPISVRYPLVEGFCALLFAFVGFFVLQRFLGRNDIESIAEIPTRIWGLIAVLLVLVTTLFTAGMIESDGQKIPAKLYVPVFLAALLALVTEIDPVPFPYFEFGTGSVSDRQEVYTDILNVLFGGLVGFLTSLIVVPFWQKGQRIPWSLALLGTGLFLGWQLAAVCALILLPYGAVCLGFKRIRPVPTLVLFGTVTIFVAMFS